MGKEVTFLGTRIGVIKAKKTAELNENRKFIAKPQVDNNFGVVAYVGTDVGTLKVGDKIYFSNQLETLLIEGAEVMVMDASNVIGKVI